MVVWNRERTEPQDDARDARPDGSDQPSADGARRPRPKDLLTAQEAADLAGVARKTVDRRVRSGDMESWEGRRNGKKVRLVSQADVLEAWPREGDDQPRPEGTDTSGHGPAAASEATSEPRRGPEPEPAASAADGVGEKTTALVSSVQVPVEVLSELRSRADRTELAERALEEERLERRATLAALVQSQDKIRALLEGPDAPPVKADRKVVYSVASIALLGICALGWRLHAVDSTATIYAAERDAAMGEVVEVKSEAARLKGETDALRETLRDERSKSDELASALKDAEHAREETIEKARAAMAFDFALRSMMGE